MKKDEQEEAGQEAQDLKRNNMESQTACEPYLSMTSVRMSCTLVRKTCWPQDESYGAGTVGLLALRPESEWECYGKGVGS